MSARPGPRLLRARPARLHAACSAAAALLATIVAHAAAPPEPPAFALPGTGDTVLVVSPHPDDESLCCGGLIDMARRAGANVAIVWMTNGDGFRWDTMVVERKLYPRGGAFHDMARRRIGEAHDAAAALGVPRDAQHFLGFPDGGMLALVLDHYYYDVPWRSKYTGDSAVSIPDALDADAVFDGRDLERAFNAVLDAVKPTLVLAPSPQDTHPDHRATGILTGRVLAARSQSDRVRYWLVHGGRNWPTPRMSYRPSQPLSVAPRGRGMPWQALTLDAPALESKRNAIEQHLTQRKVMGRVMLSYVRATELYSRTATPAESQCLSAEPCEFERAPSSEEAAL